MRLGDILSGKTETIGRKTTLIFIIKMILTISSFIGFFFVARFMGPEVIGIIGFALGIVGLFLQSDFGFGMAHNKRVSEGKDIGECLGTYIAIKSILISTAVAVLLLLIFFWERILGHGYEDPIQRDVVLMILAYYILFSLSKISTETFGGLRQSAKQQTPEFLGTFARMPIMIIVAMTAMGVVVLALSYVVTGAIMVFSAFYMLRKYEIKRPSKALMRSYVRFAAPVAIVGIFTVISLNIDKIVIQYFWNSTEVGYFYGMQRLIFVMIMISSSLGPIFFPSISHYHKKKAKKTIRYLVHRAEKLLSMVVTPLAMFFIVLAGPIIHILLSDEFLPGEETLILLAVYCLITTLSQPHSYLLLGCGRPEIAARIGITIAITNIALLLILVPRSFFGIGLYGLGSTGAALATMSSVFLGWLVAKYYTRKLFGVRSSRKIYRHLAAGALMGLALYGLHSYIWEITRWYDLLLVFGVGMGIYLALLFLMNEFRRKELDYFLDLLNPKKMTSYVGGEMRK